MWGKTENKEIDEKEEIPQIKKDSSLDDISKILNDTEGFDNCK